MKNTIFRAVIVSVLVSGAGGIAYGGKFAVILHSAAGWQLEDAEKLTINGKARIRHGASRPEITQDEYKKLPAENLGTSVIRVHKGGYLVERSAGGWAPVFPDGASFKGSGSAASLWSGATVVYQSEKGAKDAAWRPSDIFAILPGAATPAEAAVALLLDDTNFGGVGEATPAEAFAERMSLLVGISGTVTGAAQEKLKAVLANAMNNSIKHFDSGSGRYNEITQGLQFATVSEAAFLSDPQQAKLRDTLREKKKSLDLRIAVLKAFSAANEWDAFIDKYGDFEGYDESFTDLRKLHERSFKESEVVHTAEAKRLEGEKLWVPALEQVKIALKRNSGSRELAALSEKIRIESLDEDPKLRTPQVQLPRSAVQQILKYVTVAESYMNDNKFQEAEGELVSAETIAKDYPRTVLTRAMLLRARKDLPQAIEMLDRYDSLVPPDQVDAVSLGTQLRAKVEYEMRSGRDSAKQETAKAEEGGDYLTALKYTRAGLQLVPNDPDLLYHAGIDAAITRNDKEARQRWQEYLVASAAAGSSESKRRSDVMNLLPVMPTTPKPPAGTPNWFSNYNNGPGVMYDPVSLTMNAHPVDVKGSGKKQTTEFQWSGGVLLSVRTTSLAPGEAPVTVHFDYFPGHKGVRRVSTEPFEEKGDPGVPKLTAEGTVGTGKGTYTALFNDPLVNPYIVEKLTGKRVAVIVAGNAWFNPFVWDGVHTFLAEYDAEGHVKSAKPINGRNSQLIEFRWQSDRLVSIIEAGGEYRREMRYDGSKLLGETVQFRGKTSKITYRYNGERLTEADCDVDNSLDGRSRKVIFGN